MLNGVIGLNLNRRREVKLGRTTENHQDSNRLMLEQCGGGHSHIDSSFLDTDLGNLLLF